MTDNSEMFQSSMRPLACISCRISGARSYAMLCPERHAWTTKSSSERSTRTLTEQCTNKALPRTKSQTSQELKQHKHNQNRHHASTRCSKLKEIRVATASNRLYHYHPQGKQPLSLSLLLSPAASTDLSHRWIFEKSLAEPVVAPPTTPSAPNTARVTPNITPAVPAATAAPSWILWCGANVPSSMVLMSSGDGSVDNSPSRVL